MNVRGKLLYPGRHVAAVVFVNGRRVVPMNGEVAWGPSPPWSVLMREGDEWIEAPWSGVAYFSFRDEP